MMILPSMVARLTTYHKSDSAKKYILACISNQKTLRARPALKWFYGLLRGRSKRFGSFQSKSFAAAFNFFGARTRVETSIRHAVAGGLLVLRTTVIFMR